LPYRIQPEDFIPDHETEILLHGNRHVGAVVTFVGYVRDSLNKPLDSMTLECYQSMALQQLHMIEQEAKKRWSLIDCLIIHRYGYLQPSARIVLAVSLSSHRADAFNSCQFIMDMVKVSVPVWKKEQHGLKSDWIGTKTSDLEAAQKWGRLPGFDF